METIAGQQIGIAIQNIKEAFSEELAKTTDKISAAAEKNLAQIRNMIQILEGDSKELLAEVDADAQQLVNSLPLGSKRPQLKAVHPQYVVINSQSDTVLVKFSGNFPWSSDPKYPVSLSVNDQPCSALQTTTQELAFRVPTTSLDAATKDKCSYIMGKLQVLWDNGWIFSHKKTAQYKIGLAVLPLSPGRITAYYASTYQYNGNDHYPQRWVTIPLHVPPEAGWKLDHVIKTLRWSGEILQLFMKNQRRLFGKSLSNASMASLVSLVQRMLETNF